MPLETKAQHTVSMTRAANTGYPHICVDYDIHEHNDCIYAIPANQKNQDGPKFGLLLIILMTV
jgi:hypothetical protein